MAHLCHTARNAWHSACPTLENAAAALRPPALHVCVPVVDETFDDQPLPRRRKKVDQQALQSAFMRIPGMKVEAARDLLDLGLDEVYQLEGRSPDSLFSDLRRLRPETPADRVAFLRLAVYFAETDSPDPRRLHPAAWTG